MLGVQKVPGSNPGAPTTFPFAEFWSTFSTAPRIPPTGAGAGFLYCSPDAAIPFPRRTDRGRRNFRARRDGCGRRDLPADAARRPPQPPPDLSRPVAFWTPTVNQLAFFPGHAMIHVVLLVLAYEEHALSRDPFIFQLLQQQNNPRFFTHGGRATPIGLHRRGLGKVWAGASSGPGGITKWRCRRPRRGSGSPGRRRTAWRFGRCRSSARPV